MAEVIDLYKDYRSVRDTGVFDRLLKLGKPAPVRVTYESSFTPNVESLSCVILLDSGDRVFHL